MHVKRQYNRWKNHLCSNRLIMKLIHCLFIKHLFMCCMLIHHIELVFKFNKPVSIKKLPDNSVFITTALIKKLVLKKVHLLWWFRLCHSFISCFIFLNHLLRTLNLERFRESFRFIFLLYLWSFFCSKW